RRARPRPAGGFGVRHIRRQARRRDGAGCAAGRRAEGTAPAHLRTVHERRTDDPAPGRDRRTGGRGAGDLGRRRRIGDHRLLTRLWPSPAPKDRQGEAVARYLTITLDKRGVSCRARLLDDEAPRTCQAVWDALPQSGAAYHAKYARNEIYTLVPPFADPKPGRENPTVTPIPGDVVYFGLVSWDYGNPVYVYDEVSAAYSV